MKRLIKQALSRRQFIKDSIIGLTCLPAFSLGNTGRKPNSRKSAVALVKTSDRKEGVQKVLKMLDFKSPAHKKVMIKPNFNSADPAPGSTHNDTLSQLVVEMKGRGASSIIVGERSGPPPTKKVMEDKGIFQLAEELDFEIINYEELEDKDWIRFKIPGHHWNEGFYLARPAVEAEYFVSTCCLKTHQYGGVFTLSLKLAVGLTPKRMMRELHNSPDMRKMIAELNSVYNPQLIVLDGIDTFVDGGPMQGSRKKANVFLAGKDRIAVDAAGVAVLKELGSNEAIMGRRIFDQEQINRAVELGLGISRPDQIEFITQDKPSREYAEKLKSILAQG